MKQGIILPKVPLGQEPDSYKAKLQVVKQFDDYSLEKPFTLCNRLGAEVIATTAMWSEQHKVPIVLAETPVGLNKWQIVNSWTLTQMEEALQLILYRAYADDLTLYEAALIETPDILLQTTDEYMAALINKMAEQHKEIMVICGYGQTRTIPHYLYYSQKINEQDSVNGVS